jgi:molybdate transport system substrate-binding protein
MTLKTLATAAAVAAAVLSAPDAAYAADVKMLVTGAARGAFDELAPQFERDAGHKLIAQYALPSELIRKIDAGEPFDVIILSYDVDGLIKQGMVVANSRTVLGQTGLGVVIRLGAQKPDIGSVEAFKRTLLNAASVSYSGGSSGAYFLTLLDRLGIADAMKPKLRPGGMGAAVTPVAKGEVELVVIARPPVIGIAGVEWIGEIPAELQSFVVFTAGLSTAAKEAEAGRALLAFLTTPAAVAVFKAKGLDPAP